MAKRPRRIIASIVTIVAIIALLNIEVTTLQGVDYKINVIRLPLYLKILDFFDRHYNYTLLTKRITYGAKTDEEKVSKLLEWTYANVRKVPDGFPVIDDHVWSIIIRGYGAHGQSADVFTTLCNYAGLEAFFAECQPKDRSSKALLSFVKVRGKWRAFDPYYGVYFKNHAGGFADLEEIRAGNWTVVFAEKPAVDYKPFLGNIPDIRKAGLIRATIQSPLKRLLFEVNRMRRGRQNGKI